MKLEFAANKEGAMLAVAIPDKIAKDIAIPDGERPEELHITLFYFYDNDDLTEDQRQAIISLSSSLASEYQYFDIRLTGTGIFEENEERPLYAVVSSPELEDYRSRLAVALDIAGIVYSKEHEYIPHLTLKYLNEEKPPLVDVQELFSTVTISVWFADKHIDIPLGNRTSFIRKVRPGRFLARPKAGQKQRIGSGTWETKTNRQQRKLVRTFDEWSAGLKRELSVLARKGAGIPELQAYLDEQVPKLQERLTEIQTAGIRNAVKTAAGSRSEASPVVATAERQINDNIQLIRERLIPHIHEKLTLALAAAVPAMIIGGLAIEQQKSIALAIKNATLASRNLPAQYAGGYWVAIFETQKTLGGMREDERAAQGLPVEPVRWVLDPRAIHCKASVGFYGCVDLAGEYPGGWRTLKTVPAGQVTCRGNCRCHIEVFRDGEWRRGVYDD